MLLARLSKLVSRLIRRSLLPEVVIRIRIAVVIITVVAAAAEVVTVVVVDVAAPLEEEVAVAELLFA